MVISKLIKNKKVNTADRSNCPILFTYQRGHSNIVYLLWQEQRVKNTLKKDMPDLYN